MQKRIAALIDTTSDPLAADILCHHSCWTKYALIKNKESNNRTKDIQNDDARNLFFKHVNVAVFQERETEYEIRSPQFLLNDYKRIVCDFGYEAGNIKSSYLKELLIKK